MLMLLLLCRTPLHYQQLTLLTCFSWLLTAAALQQQQLRPGACHPGLSPPLLKGCLLRHWCGGMM
jgi:hypothetical protein